MAFSERHHRTWKQRRGEHASCCGPGTWWSPSANSVSWSGRHHKIRTCDWDWQVRLAAKNEGRATRICKGPAAGTGQRRVKSRAALGPRGAEARIAPRNGHESFQLCGHLRRGIGQPDVTLDGALGHQLRRKFLSAQRDDCRKVYCQRDRALEALGRTHAWRRISARRGNYSRDRSLLWLRPRLANWRIRVFAGSRSGVGRTLVLVYGGTHPDAEWHSNILLATGLDLVSEFAGRAEPFSERRRRVAALRNNTAGISVGSAG